MRGQGGLLRLFIRFTRWMPPWAKTRRAGVVAAAGGAFVVLGVIADVGDSLSFLFPGPKLATSAEISALKDSVLAELRLQGVVLDAPAEGALGEAIAFFRNLPDPRGRRAVALMETAPPEQALRLFTETATAYAAEHGGKKAAEAWEALGAVAYPVDPEAARRAYEKALALEPDDPYTHFRLGSLYQDFALLDDAHASYKRALELAGRAGDQTLAALARMNIGLVAKQRSRFDEAEAAFTGAARDFEALGDERNLAIALGNLGILFGALGDVDKAEARYLDVLNIGYKLRDPSIVAEANLGLGSVWAWRRDDLYAAELYGRALAHFEWLNLPDRIAFARMRLGHLALDSGSYFAARLHFTEAQQLYAQMKQPLGVATARLSMAAVHAGENDFARACEEARAVRSVYAEAGVVAFVGHVDDGIERFCAAAPPSEQPDLWTLRGVTDLDEFGPSAWKPFSAAQEPPSEPGAAQREN